MSKIERLLKIYEEETPNEVPTGKIEFNVDLPEGSLKDTLKDLDKENPLVPLLELLLELEEKEIITNLDISHDGFNVSYEPDSENVDIIDEE